MKTDICVTGFHYKPYFYQTLKELKGIGFNVFIVAHKDNPEMLKPFKHMLVENIGLEFHCYNTYLMEHWQGENNIIFCHDDLNVMPVLVNNEIISGAFNFRKLAELMNTDIGQAYVFHNGDDAEWNGFHHGRMILMNKTVCEKVKEDGGFWYDESNRGNTMPDHAFSPNGYHYNEAVDRFWKQQEAYKHMGYNTNCIVFSPAILFERRGMLPDEYIYHYGKFYV